MIRAILLLCFVFALFSNSAAAKVFAPEVFTLANGLRVVIVRNALSEAFAQMLWVSAGAVDDPEGKAGVAHYLEHMMFKDTKRLEAGDFSASIAARGGKDNAFTDADSTAYHITIGTETLGLAMALEAERLDALLLDPSKVETERAVILNERRERTQGDPAAAFQEEFTKTFWSGHPYGRPIIGEERTIKNITVEDLQAFYKRFYVPRNAVLLISGAVKTADVLRLASGTFGRLPSEKERGSLALSTPLRAPSLRVMTMRDARVRQPFFVKRTLVPSLRNNAQQAAAFDVLAEVLGGGEVGILYRRFVMEKGQVSAIDVHYDSVTRGPATFSIAGTPVPNGDPKALARAVALYLRALERKGFSAADVGAAKKRLLASAVFVQDDLMVPAHILGQALANGYDLDAVEAWPTRIARVQARDVATALHALLAEGHALTGFLLTENAP